MLNEHNTKIAHNGQPAPILAQPPKSDNQILVTLTRPCLTRTTGFILPKNTQGRVVGAYLHPGSKRPCWQIDFGLSRVINLPANSPLLKVLNGGER